MPVGGPASLVRSPVDPVVRRPGGGVVRSVPDPEAVQPAPLLERHLHGLPGAANPMTGFPAVVGAKDRQLEDVGDVAQRFARFDPQDTTGSELDEVVGERAGRHDHLIGVGRHRLGVGPVEGDLGPGETEFTLIGRSVDDLRRTPDAAIARDKQVATHGLGRLGQHQPMTPVCGRQV